MQSILMFILFFFTIEVLSAEYHEYGAEADKFSINALVSQREVHTGDTVEVICQVYNPDSKKYNV